MQIKKVDIVVFVGNLTPAGISLFFKQELVRKLVLHCPLLSFSCQPFDLIGLDKGVKQRVIKELESQFGGGIFPHFKIEELHRKETRDNGEVVIGVLMKDSPAEDLTTRPCKQGCIKAFSEDDLLTLALYDISLLNETSKKDAILVDDLNYAKKFFNVFNYEYEKLIIIKKNLKPVKNRI